MADLKPAPSGPGILDHIGGAVIAVLSHLPSILLFLLKAAGFVLLSIIVVPSMIIMLTLHKTWEKMLEGVMLFQMGGKK